MEAPNCLSASAYNETSRNAILADQILSGVFTSFLVLFGCSGNLAAGWGLRSSRFAKQGLWKSLVALTLWDSVLLISVLCYYALETLLSLLNPTTQRYNQIIAYITVFAHPLIRISYMASSWFVVAITTQRFLAVRDPLILRVQPPRQLVKLCHPAYSLSLLSIFLNIPAFFELRAEACWHPFLGTQMVEARPTELRKNRTYLFWYHAIFNDLILSNLGPCLIVGVFTAGILKKLKEANTERQRMVLRRRSSAAARSGAAERCMTLILVIIIIKFLLSHTLPVILDLWERFGDYHRHILIFRTTTNVSNFLVVLNSATNWLVYVTGREVTKFRLCRRIVSRTRKVFPFSAEEVARLDITRETIWNKGAQKWSVHAIGVFGTDGFLGVLSDPDFYKTRHPELMSEMVRELIDGLNEAVLRKSPKIYRTAQSRLREVGRKHRQANVTFKTELWKSMKDFVSVAARYDTNFHDREETSRCWGKLMTLLIYEMKEGFLNEAVSQSQRSQVRSCFSFNEDSSFSHQLHPTHSCVPLSDF